MAAAASPVNLFLHDRDHPYEHESAKYRAVAGSLTESVFVMTNNGSPALSDFANSSGRSLMLREHAADHWSPGGILDLAMHVAT